MQQPVHSITFWGHIVFTMLHELPGWLDLKLIFMVPAVTGPEAFIVEHQLFGCVLRRNLALRDKKHTNTAVTDAKPQTQKNWPFYLLGFLIALPSPPPPTAKITSLISKALILQEPFQESVLNP